MAIVLASKPGLSSTTALSIPKTWDATWFRGFISNLLKGADVRNAVGANGIVVSGTIASPYATISFGPGPIVINTPAGTVAVTINGASGQQALVVNGSETITGTPGLTALTVKASSGESNIDMWAGAANGGALLQGYNSTGATRTGYLEFLSGTGGGGGATETVLDNDGATVNDWLSFITGGVRRVRIDGTGQVLINAPNSGAIPLQISSTNTFTLYLKAPTAVPSGIVLEQNGSITTEFGADGTQTMWTGSANGDFVIRQLTGTIWLVVNSNTLAMSISSTGAINFNAVATTTVAPGAGGAGALPATPAGYATFSIGGVAHKIPYY
jgi:hypothetical protein